MKFLTNEQKAVVESRIASGYEWLLLGNGNYKIWKGKHTMVINCLGYDCYVPTYML